MFDQIKLPVCPVCGAWCVSAVSQKALGMGFDVSFSCGSKFSVNQDREPLIVDGCKDAEEVVQMLKSQAKFLRAELARLQADPDIRALDAARQRHAEVRAHVAQVQEQTEIA
jgi:hypothetical protein